MSKKSMSALMVSPDGHFQDDYAQSGSKQLRNVIPWPKGQVQSIGASSESDEAAAVLRKLGYSEAISSVATPATEGDGMAPLLLYKRASSGTSLREEIPAAVQVYDTMLATFRTMLPKIVTKGDIQVGILEECAAAAVDSLERNRNALLCVTKNAPASPYIYSHSVNVSIYLTAFALDCGKSRYEAITAGVAGLLHDIGMALLPLSLLNSKQRLTPTEQVLVKRHPQLACELFSGVPHLCSDIFFAALEHHEAYSGGGYPTGLSGSTISFIGHLTAIASSYDAISSSRLFQKPLHPHAALTRMFKGRGAQYHAAMLENFARMVGIFPVGSVVELEDGYRGIVCATSPQTPTRPVVLLTKDPKGRSMTPFECDMGAENVANISQCLFPQDIDLDAGKILEVLMEKSS